MRLSLTWVKRKKYLEGKLNVRSSVLTTKAAIAIHSRIIKKRKRTLNASKDQTKFRIQRE